MRKRLRLGELDTTTRGAPSYKPFCLFVTRQNPPLKRTQDNDLSNIESGMVHACRTHGMDEMGCEIVLGPRKIPSGMGRHVIRSGSFAILPHCTLVDRLWEGSLHKSPASEECAKIRLRTGEGAVSTTSITIKPNMTLILFLEAKLSVTPAWT